MLAALGIAAPHLGKARQRVGGIIVGQARIDFRGDLEVGRVQFDLVHSALQHLIGLFDHLRFSVVARAAETLGQSHPVLTIVRLQLDGLFQVDVGPAAVTFCNGCPDLKVQPPHIAKLRQERRQKDLGLMGSPGPPQDRGLGLADLLVARHGREGSVEHTQSVSGLAALGNH